MKWVCLTSSFNFKRAAGDRSWNDKALNHPLLLVILRITLSTDRRRYFTAPPPLSATHQRDIWQLLIKMHTPLPTGWLVSNFNSSHRIRHDLLGIHPFYHKELKWHILRTSSPRLCYLFDLKVHHFSLNDIFRRCYDLACKPRRADNFPGVSLLKIGL